MDQDRIKGTLRDVGGKAEGAIGEALGDRELQGEGALDQVKGKAQDLYGQAKDVAADAVDRASSLAKDYTGPGSVAHREVSDNPMLAILMAGVVGYLIGLVLHGRGRSDNPDRDARGRFKS